MNRDRQIDPAGEYWDKKDRKQKEMTQDNKTDRVDMILNTMRHYQDPITKEAKLALKKLVDEIIGEDTVSPYQPTVETLENHLKLKQRQRARERGL